MKILFIDDSSTTSELYSDLFNADNHSIKIVNSGREGLELAVINDYDLILLDLFLSKYDGGDFLYELKIQKPSELKKVVVISRSEQGVNQIGEIFRYGIHSIQKKPSGFQSLETSTNPIGITK